MRIIIFCKNVVKQKRVFSLVFKDHTWTNRDEFFLNPGIHEQKNWEIPTKTKKYVATLECEKTSKKQQNKRISDILMF
jgi:hypothetical protein